MNLPKISERWAHVINEVDNWLWLVAAVIIYVIGKKWDIPEMYALAGACLVKIKGESKKDVALPMDKA